MKVSDVFLLLMNCRNLRGFMGLKIKRKQISDFAGGIRHATLMKFKSK